jgi:endo-1,4-beta-xylanase
MTRENGRFGRITSLAVVTLLGFSGTLSGQDTSLKQAAGTSFQIGVGISESMMRNQQSAEIQLLLQHFTIVTPENSMKPAAIRPTQARYDFRVPDQFVEFATRNKLEVVGHCLVWAKDDRTPEWFYRDGEELASRELILERVREHVTTVVSRYRGRITQWDVVNEALDDGPNPLRDSGWSRATEFEFIKEAFRAAHAADPAALLIYNDYNNEAPVKRERMVKLLNVLLEDQVPVHAVGLQGHYEIDAVPYEDIDQTIQAIRDLGLKVVISEVDIDVIPRGRWWAEGGKFRAEIMKINPYPINCPDDLLQRQAEQYSKLFSIYRKHSDAIERVTFWNLHDGQSWLNYFPWNRVNYPLLFDRQLQPKPAFHSVIKSLSEN